MSDHDDVIEGEVTDMHESTATGTALATRPSTTAVAEAWTPSFVIPVDEMVARVEAKHEFFSRVMRDGDHYGKIPGTGDKPALLKPGAELLLSSMGLYAEFEDADPPTIDYGEEGREGLIRFRRRCCVYRQMGDMRVLIAKAEGSCSSREEKYRWRDGKRLCPQCNAAAIIKGKEEYGGGWLCFAKKGGCGAKFSDGDKSIEDQQIGRVPNPNLADAENTILKMADKRALVATTLIATGCSDIFTQDVEDGTGSDDVATKPAQTSKPAQGAKPSQNGSSKTNRVKNDLKNRAANPSKAAPSAEAQRAAAATSTAGQSTATRATGNNGSAERNRRAEAIKLRDSAGITGDEWVKFLKETTGQASLLSCDDENLDKVITRLTELQTA